MIRKAFLTRVKPGMIDQYEKSHNPIWPELHDVLKKHGISNYSIFHDAKRSQLFGYMEIEDEEKLKKLSSNEVCQKWWRYMTEYLVSDSEDSVKAQEAELSEIFHID